MSAPGLGVRRWAWLRWPRRTARLRFTAVYAGFFVLSGAALVAITYGLFQRATRYRNPQLPQIPHTPTIQQLQTLQLPSGYGKALPGLPQALSVLAQDQTQFTADQHSLLASVPAMAGGPGRTLAPGQVQQQIAHAQQQLTQDQHQLTQAVNQLAAAVHQVAQSGTAQAAQRASDSHQLLVNSGIALAIVAVLALIAGWLVAGRMLRPIRTITRTARRISSTSLHERLALEGPPDELKELGDTLDDLFGRLDAAFEAQRHFVANASHELRTPLTAERNLLQVALDDPGATAASWRVTAQELLASNDEQKNLIEALLALASSESGIEHREPTDLADICHAVLPRPGPDADLLALDIQTTISSAPVDGDPRLIERLVTNLVDNAICHNVAGGQVHISTSRTEGQAVLTVTNTGPVIPPGEVDRLFQPFQRLDARRAHYKNGHGLGLSIVRAVATTHQAAVTAVPLSQGGLTVTVTFAAPGEAGTRPKRMPRARRLAVPRS